MCLLNSVRQISLTDPNIFIEATRFELAVNSNKILALERSSGKQLPKYIKHVNAAVNRRYLMF